MVGRRSPVFSLGIGLLSVGACRLENPAFDRNTGSSTTLTTSSSSSTAKSGCGDNTLDDTEECDDGNLDGGDGCSPLCHREPTGISLGQPTSSTGQAGAKQAESSHGMGSCSFDNGLITGFSGWREGVGDDPWICEPTFLCDTIKLDDALQVTLSSTSDIKFDGCIETDDPWTRSCPPGQVVIGFRGRSGTLLDRLQPRCAPLLVQENEDGFSVAWGPVIELEPIGGDGGDPFGPLDCPGNAVTVATSIYLGSWVHALELLCETPTLTYD